MGECQVSQPAPLAPAGSQRRPAPAGALGVVLLRHGDQFLLTNEAVPVTLLRHYSFPQ